MKKRSFLQLKKLWNLSEDTSLEDLLIHAKNLQKSFPDDPKIEYTVAELLRHTDQNNEARQHYKQAIKLTDKRTQLRGKKLQYRIQNKRDDTRAKFLLATFLPIIILSLLAGIMWKTFTEPEKLPADADPEKFAFTEWLAKQQMVQIMTTLQQQNPELTFDFSRPSASSQSPMEFMQSLMKPDAIERMKRDNERNANNQNNNGEGRAAFQCSHEPPVNCSLRDIPNAPGERRREVVLLMEAYNAILDTEQDCEKLEESIETIGQQLQWRKSERRIKANLEDIALECYFRKKNVKKTIEHARKLQCTGDQGYINSVYWFMTAVKHQAGDKAGAHTSYKCFQEAIDYIEKQDFNPAYVAARHRESGALAWLYFDDLVVATAELKRGRTILKNIRNKTPSMLQVISEINLDLMETYVTANIDSDSFAELLEEVNSSGLLTDGYKQIKDTLVAIYHMQNNRNDKALIPLNSLTSRFKLMPEYICGWDWSGFKRGLDKSIPDSAIRQQAVSLVDAANCYKPQTTETRIQSINQVKQWLKGL